MSHFLDSFVIVAAASIVGYSWLSWQLLRQNGRILLRLEDLEKRIDRMEFGETEENAGLPLGSRAPDFDLPDLNGSHRTLAQFRGQSVLLIFFNPACGFCRALAPRLAAVLIEMQKADGRPPLAIPAAGNGYPLPLIITCGDGEQNRRFFAEHPVECSVVVQRHMEQSADYRTSRTPSGYLIGPEGKIASELAVGAETLLMLASQKVERQFPREPANRFKNHSLAGSKIERNGLKAGTPAPDFRLPRLDGRGELSLAELRGRRVLLVFSSPHCEPCDQLAPKLEKFHLEEPELQMVMISKGEPSECRAKMKQYGLTFPVLLQRGWEISRRYAMFATPIAYLIDQNGLIVQDVAVGDDPILRLLASVGRETK